MCLQQVEPPIQVDVAGRQTHPSLLLASLIQCHAALESSLAERPVPVIQEQKTRCRVAGDVYVWPAVVVKVGCDGGEPVAPRSQRDTRTLSDVGKRAVTIVAV